jgi:hypothetical protein
MFRFVKNLFGKAPTSDHAAAVPADDRASRERYTPAPERRLRPSLEKLEERLTPGGGIWAG